MVIEKRCIIQNADTKECIKDVSRLEHWDSITETPELGQNEGRISEV